MSKSSFTKLFQQVKAATAYFLFGLGALIVGLFFRVLSPIPFIPSTTKQKWIRWCIHHGSLTFLRVLEVLGLIKYSFDLNSMVHAKPGYIVIANHPSLIDALLFFAVNKDLCCLVKGTLWDNFFIGAIPQLAGFIPNNTPEAVETAIAKLQAGESLLIFPEGTRNQNDDNLHFKRGASNIAVLSGAPIIPVLVKCHPRALQKGDKWYIIPDEKSHLSLCSSKILTLEECIDTSRPNTLQYRELTQFLEQFYHHWSKTGEAASHERIKGSIKKQ